MENILVVILIVVYIVAASKGKGKRNAGKKKHSAPGRRVDAPASPSSVLPQAAFGGKRPADGGHGRMRTQLEMDLQAAGRANRQDEGEDPCHPARPNLQRSGMRLASAGQEAMRQAGEGEDPCHTGDAAYPEDAVARACDEAAMQRAVQRQETLREDVLRGVVMSEILMRPHERAAIQRARRRM